MIGILTEKPSAARNFAKALGGMQGSYQGQAYTIVHARGHLYQYVDPADMVPSSLHDVYKSWRMDTLPWDETDFSWKMEAGKGNGIPDLLASLSQTLTSCDEIVIACDVDPSGEGQAIGWEVIDHLPPVRAKISRMYFMDESEKEIQKAFLSRKPLPAMAQDPEYRKAMFRSRWDYLSMQFTRIATICTGNQAMLRQGRLKSAMVQMVGDGLKALADYKEVPFYSNKFRDDHGIVYTNPKEPRYPSDDQVPQIYHASSVVCDSRKQKTTPPPKLMDLAALSARLAPKGYKAKDVLAVYQKMYEAQILSYPRSEDKTITPEQFADLLPLAPKIAAVVGVDPALLTHRTPRKTHVKTGGAHGANRPGPKVPSSLQALTMYGDCAPEIYRLLARNTLAMFCEDYLYEQQNGHVADYPDFTGVARVPVSLGWKQIFDADAEEEDVSALGLGTVAEPFVARGVNPKPPTPTMKWLMKQLEQRDVGTGATRTSTYADVTNAGTKYPLLQETKGKLSMTPYGEMSYGLLKDTKIGDLTLTEQLQQQMRDVEAGTLDPAVGLAQMRELVLHDKDVMQKNAASLGLSGAARKERYTGVWNGREVSFARSWGGYRFTDRECEALCAGQTIPVTGKKKTGEPLSVQGCLKEQTYQGRTYIGFAPTTFLDDTKKTGGNSMATQKERYVGTWKGKEVSFVRIWGGHRFTDEECEALCDGKTIEITGTKKNGDPMPVKGRLEAQEYQGHPYVGFSVTEFLDNGKPPRKFSQHYFTEDEYTLLCAGKTVYIEHLVSKKTGRHYSAKICWDADAHKYQFVD